MFNPSGLFGGRFLFESPEGSDGHQAVQRTRMVPLLEWLGDPRLADGAGALFSVLAMELKLMLELRIHTWWAAC